MSLLDRFRKPKGFRFPNGIPRVPTPVEVVEPPEYLVPEWLKTDPKAPWVIHQDPPPMKCSISNNEKGDFIRNYLTARVDAPGSGVHSAYVRFKAEEVEQRRMDVLNMGRAMVIANSGIRFS